MFGEHEEVAVRWIIAAALILSPVAIIVLSSARAITHEQTGTAVGLWIAALVFAAFRWLIFGENNLAE